MGGGGGNCAQATHPVRQFTHPPKKITVPLPVMVQ